MNTAIPVKMDIRHDDFMKLSHSEKRKLLVKSMGDTSHVDWLLNQIEINKPVAKASYEQLGMSRKEALKIWGM